MVQWVWEKKTHCDALATYESVQDLNRFYLPEEDAPRVEEVFRQPGRLFEIEVNVTPENVITPTALLIDGMPWKSAVQMKDKD